MSDNSQALLELAKKVRVNSEKVLKELGDFRAQHAAPDFLWNLGSALMFGALVLVQDVRSLQRLVLDASCSHKTGYCRQCVPQTVMEERWRDDDSSR